MMPAYNAEKTIEEVFSRIPEEAKKRINKYIVVDDGSQDNTHLALSRISLNFKNFVVLKHNTNRGYGATEKTLLNFALKEGVELGILLHSDGQYSPEKIPELLEPFDKDEADLVQGSRILGGGTLQGGMPLYKYIANRCLTTIENWAFEMKLTDYHSGYMLYSRNTLLSIPVNQLSDSFEFDLEMIIAAKILGLRVKEIAIPTIYADEVSYLNPIKYGIDVLSIIRRYRMGKYHAMLGLKKEI
ncbi:glycosyltransferase family 2 protein [Acidobacteriota bacterium]